MKVVLLLSVLLLAASTAVAQDATSTFLGCYTTFTPTTTLPTGPIGTTNVAIGTTFFCCTEGQVAGVESPLTAAFVVSTSSPADSGGTLTATFQQSINTSVSCFSYLVGTDEYRLLNITVKVGTTNIVNGVQTVQVGTPITLAGSTFSATSGITSGATTPFADVGFTFGYTAGRAISYTVNFNDGTPSVTTPITTKKSVAIAPITHKYFPPTQTATSVNVFCWFTDGVVTVNLTTPASFSNTPCPVGQAANSGNTSCIDCYSKCSCTASCETGTFCRPLGNNNPVCTCATGKTGPDCSLSTGSAITGPVQSAGATNSSVTVGGQSIAVSFQNGLVRKRVVPAGTSFVLGPYTIPAGEFPNTATVFRTNPIIALTAAQINGNNQIVPFGEILLLTIQVSTLNLVAGTSAGNTMTMYYRTGANTYVEVTNAGCGAGICAKYGLDPTSCKSVNDFVAIIGICGNGGNFVLAQNIANVVNPPPINGFVTGGSITATAPTPVAPSQENQQLPNGKPSAISPTPVPTPQVLPPNSPFSPPTFSGAAIVQPIVLTSFVVVILTLLVL